MRRTRLICIGLLKSVYGKPVWAILQLAAALTAITLYGIVYKTEPALALHMTAYAQMLSTLLIMMIGIQLKNETRRLPLEEVVLSYSPNTVFFLCCQVIVIASISLIGSLLVFVGITMTSLWGSPPLWIWQNFAYITLLYGMPSLIMGVWGLLIAQWNRGRSVYLPATIVWLFTSSLAADYSAVFHILGFDLGRTLQNAFSMGIAGFRDIQGLVMTPPIELPRWIMRSVIAVFLIALLLIDQSRKTAVRKPDKRRKAIAETLAVLTGIGLLFSLGARYQVFFSRFADPGLRVQYTWNKAEQYKPCEPVSLKTWPNEKKMTISDMDIALHCTAQGINARVAMKARMDANISIHAFTLYSDFQVDSVLLDGTPCNYEQSHDGLLVTFPEEKALGDVAVLEFKYHGFSLPLFPANESTVQLNQRFAWMPWPGVRIALKYGNFYDFMESEDFFIADWQMGDRVNYRLYYDGPGNLYTNLTHEGGNRYSGFSDKGVSLYSGMICIQHRGVNAYVPGSNHRQASLLVNAVLDAYPVLSDLCERMNAPRRPAVPKSIRLIEMKPHSVIPYPFPAFPCELISDEDFWEIRQTSTSFALIERNRYKNDPQAYQASRGVKSGMAVSYLLSPSAGLPLDAPHSSVRNFAAWLCYYIEAQNMDEPLRAQYKTGIMETCIGTERDYICGKAVPEVPLSAEELAEIEPILRRMDAGDDFDGAFRALYHRLIQGELIIPADFIRAFAQ